MNDLIKAKGYIDQFLHVKNDTKNRIVEVIKEFNEVSGDDTQSYYVYTCLDENKELVIEFSVDINDYVELIEEVDCY